MCDTYKTLRTDNFISQLEYVKSSSNYEQVDHEFEFAGAGYDKPTHTTLYWHNIVVFMAGVLRHIIEWNLSGFNGINFRFRRPLGLDVNRIFHIAFEAQQKS